MRLIVEKTEKLTGAVAAPPSKSHTHRAVIIASLARGESVIQNPSLCDDCKATIEACRKFGAKIEVKDNLSITGVGGKPRRSDADVDVGSSGTTMRFMAAAYSLCEGPTTLTGDVSVRSRPMGPLLGSLADLGAKRAKSLNNDSCPPVCVAGRLRGGETVIDGQSSQFISALLITTPLARNDSIIEAQNMKSRPYIAMTMRHMERAGVRALAGESSFFVPAGQCYKPGDYSVPGDYSSAAFLLAAAEATGSEIQINGLEQDDPQGDSAIIGIIGRMRADSEKQFDLRDMPDLLPVLAVLGCLAEGTTVLKNVQHARAKESNRISAICAELGKMGADISETDDGVIARHSALRGAELDPHGDHRIAMALAVAGLAAEGRTTINNAGVISKSYPGFARDLEALGANVRAVE